MYAKLLVIHALLDLIQGDCCRGKPASFDQDSEAAYARAEAATGLEVAFFFETRARPRKHDMADSTGPWLVWIGLHALQELFTLGVRVE